MPTNKLDPVLTDYFDYKKYIQARIFSTEVKKGYQSQLAAAAGCQRSYLSQVINGSTHLTHEHAIGLARFWQFTDLETIYWLDLLSYCRAGTQGLKHFYKERIAHNRRELDKILNRLDSAEGDGAIDKAQYFSSWYWSAVHLTAGLEKINNSEQIAEFLGLQLDLVNFIVNGLVSMGLMHWEADVLKSSPKNIHLPKDSPLFLLHHASWRRFSLERQSPSEESLQFSSAISLSKADRKTLKDMILNFIADVGELVDDSVAETAIALNIDLLDLQKKH